MVHVYTYVPVHRLLQENLIYFLFIPVTQTRLLALERAEAFLSKYLGTCERISVMDEADDQAWHSLLEGGRQSISAGQGHVRSREQKIERFR